MQFRSKELSGQNALPEMLSERPALAGLIVRTFLIFLFLFVTDKQFQPYKTE